MKLQACSREFREMQTSYGMQLKQFKGGGSLEELLGAGYKETKAEVDTGFNDMQAQEMEHMNELAQERDEDIQRIVKSINELVCVCAVMMGCCDDGLL